ncbi:MAG: transmembrane 220 family protein [Owenweeksia sp.]|nr:transmembrane 220 family protein [Owenweeksia sp.]
MKVRIISFLLFLIFALFAYWQGNDPDAALWITIYGLIALVSLLRLFKIYSRGITLLLMLGLLVYSLFYIPGFVEWLSEPSKGEIFSEVYQEKLYLEETREFMGLVLGFLGMLIHYRLK